MNWFLWTYLSIAIFDAIMKIALIGHERRPRRPGVVACDLFVNGLLAWGVIYYGARP